MRKMIKICTAFVLILALGAALWTVQDGHCSPHPETPGEDGVRPWPMASSLPVILVLPALRRRNGFLSGKQNPRMREFCIKNSVKSRLF